MLPSVRLVKTVLAGIIFLTGAVHWCRAETIEIHDDLYSVSIDARAGSFSVLHGPSGKSVLTGGALTGTNGRARTVDVTDSMLGKGQGVEVSYPNGNHEVVSLFKGIPFVIVRTTFHNAGQSPVVLNHLPSVSAAVNLGKPRKDIRTLGTGGLLEPDHNPGSYAFLAVLDPATRNGVVGGWLTHDRGDGIVFSPTDGDSVRVQAQLDYGRLRIKPGGDAAGEMFALGYFDDARLGLEAYADAVAKVSAIKMLPKHPGYCTWYAEVQGGASDEKHLAQLAETAAKSLKPFGFNFIQIDDGWQAGVSQNGPNKDFSEIRPNGPYPSGMKVSADHIKQLGFTPGIWFMPFAGTWNDPYYKDHQDWFVKGPDGKAFDTVWGGTCLDMTQSGARDHLREVANRLAHVWGYQLFKMDGLWTGSGTRQTYVNDGYRDDQMGEAEFADPDKTNIEALRDGIKLVRKTAGPDVFLLGCCASQNMRSFGGSFGLLDAMRVGPDTGAGDIGALRASRLWFLNGRVWWNDPDCVSIRAAVPLDQARVNASFVAITDDLFYNSDWLPDLPSERLDILRRCMLSHGLHARPVDVFEHEPARIWHLPDTRQAQRRDVVAFFNWDKADLTISSPVERIGLPPAAEYVAFDFWANKFVPPFKQTLSVDLPPNSCRVLAVRAVADHPQLLSTSRHITQGMVDVSNEHWDASASRLTAVSQVVENDPYELRIVVPPGEKSWVAREVSASDADTGAGVGATFKQDGPQLRVTISSPASRAVRWSVRFERSPIVAGGPRPGTELDKSMGGNPLRTKGLDDHAPSLAVNVLPR